VTGTLSLSELDLPRRNGELAFDAPWQSTVFALAAAVVEQAFGGDREPFPPRAHHGHRRSARPALLGKLDHSTRGAAKPSSRLVPQPSGLEQAVRASGLTSPSRSGQT
jgi:hypothetical protein